MNGGNRFRRGTGDQPRIIAHRGLSSRAPENTLAAIDSALRAGASMIEVDVHLTADDEVVAIHDRTLQRTTTGNGAVRSYALAELSSIDAGSWFDASFSDERIPTLRQILDRTKDRAELNVELKAYPLHRIEPDHLAATVLGCVTEADALSRVLFTSFDANVLRHLRHREPRASVGLLLGRFANIFRDPMAVLSDLGAEVFICSRREFSTSRMADAQTRGVAMFVYTVNDPAEALRLADLGVDGLITDAADTLLSPVT